MSEPRPKSPAVQAILEFHAMGVQSLSKRPRAERGYGEGAAAKEAKLLGTTPEYLRKARAFADSDSGYTVAELERLCGDVEAHADKFAKLSGFGPTHVIRLLPGRMSVGRGRRSSN